LKSTQNLNQIRSAFLHKNSSSKTFPTPNHDIGYSTSALFGSIIYESRTRDILCCHCKKGGLRMLVVEDGAAKE
jgi:hypothetical protein